MKNHYLPVIYIFVLAIVLAGCGKAPATSAVAEVTSTTELQQPVSSATATLTPDACSPEQLQAEVQKIHRHMREFDDASVLAASITRDQLSGSIAELQRIRREAEDETIPACLTNLKTYQLQHMNTVIETFLAFIRGADAQSLDQGRALAGQQHDQYILELARVLGLTVVPATPPPSTPAETPTP